MGGSEGEKKERGKEKKRGEQGREVGRKEWRNERNKQGKNKSWHGTREMTQRLRALRTLVALTEDLGSVPAHTWRLTTMCNPC